MSDAARRSATRRSGDDPVVQAAWMYYHDGLNQAEVAAGLGVSRATVVKYLQSARERGYIRVTLDETLFTGHRLAGELCAAFALAGAFVLPERADEDGERVFLRVARGGALWLASLLAPGDRLGVSWGRTVYELAEAMEPTAVPDLVVSQLVGSMATPYGFTAELCSAHLARKLSASCVNLHAPAVLSDAALAHRLRAEPIIGAQLAALSRCNKALFAAGSCSVESHIVGAGVATREELAGAEIEGPLRERMMAVELEALRGLETGLLVSSGEDRVLPMLSALAGRYATHVVTGARTAEALLQALAAGR